MTPYNRKAFFTNGMTILLVLLIITLKTKAQEQNSLTWIGAINQVLEQNPNLASAKASLEGERANIAIARANYLPGLTFLGKVSQSKTGTFGETGYTPASSALAGASLSQMVYNEQYLANFKIQKYLFANQEEQYRNTRYNTILAAGKSYINLLFAIDLLEVQQENLLITEQNLQGSRDRQEVGSTNMQEVLRWETKLYADQQSVGSQKAAVIISQGNLNQLLNVPLETKQDLEKLTLENNGFIFLSNIVSATVNDEKKAIVIRDYLVELGLANSPILAGIDQQLQAQNRKLEANRRWVIPNFNFSASADAKFDLNKETADQVSENIGFWKVGLTMYYPIVDGGANINKVKQSGFQLSALELQKNDISTSLEQTIRASASVVINDFVNIGLAKAQADAAQQNYDLINDAYQIGESSLLDLLDAQNQKLGADISSRIALYTFFTDLLTVEQVIGYFPFMASTEETNVIIKELEQRLLRQ